MRNKSGVASQSVTRRDLMDHASNQTYHIAMASCGNATLRFEEAWVAMKSTLIMLGSNRIVFHIFATQGPKQHINQQMNTLPKRLKSQVKLTFHKPYFPSNEWPRLFHFCATQRIFIADKLTSVRRVLYMDTDTILVSPLYKVWREFSRFTDSHVMGMTRAYLFNKGWYDHINHSIPHLPPHGYNSDVLLLDLERIRQLQWANNLTTVMRLQTHERSNILGDQDILNEYFYYFPERLHTLPCTFNFVSDFCRTTLIQEQNVTQTCLNAERDGAYIVHANRGLAHKKLSIFSILYNVIMKHTFNSTLHLGVIEPILDGINRKYKSELHKFSLL